MAFNPDHHYECVEKARKHLEQAYHYLCDLEEMDVEFTSSEYRFWEQCTEDVVFYMNRLHGRLPEKKVIEE